MYSNDRKVCEQFKKKGAILNLSVCFGAPKDCLRELTLRALLPSDGCGRRGSQNIGLGYYMVLPTMDAILVYIKNGRRLKTAVWVTPGP